MIVYNGATINAIVNVFNLTKITTFISTPHEIYPGTNCQYLKSSWVISCQLSVSLFLQSNALSKNRTVCGIEFGIIIAEPSRSFDVKYNCRVLLSTSNKLINYLDKITSDWIISTIYVYKISLSIKINTIRKFEGITGVVRSRKSQG